LKKDKIQIGPFKYTVLYDQEKLKLKAGLDEELVGYCDHHNQELIIDDTQSLAMLNETILHEFLHACFFTTGLTTRLLEEENLEECIVSALSPMLYDCLLRNKGFFKELVKL
jgi:hypothetical protein